MEELASKYVFHLIGDSTSRRLGESFVSIFTGQGSTHPVAQRNRNFSSGNLEVGTIVSDAFFFCAGCTMEILGNWP